jgi:hypothetical protein
MKTRAVRAYSASRPISSRMITIATVLLLMASLSVLVTTRQASASLSSTCQSSGYTCVEGGYDSSTMNNNWATKYYGAGGSVDIGNPPHNCTLYAAWMLAQHGAPDPGQSWGNAKDWGHNLASLTNGTPAVGSIAWYDSGRSGVGANGHVGYVAKLDLSNGRVFIESDNYIGGSSGYTSSGWVAISSPSGYIHVKDVPTTLPAQPGSPRVMSTTGTTAVLAWTDASTNEDSFVSQYRIGTGAWMAGPSVGANTTTMTVTGLTRGTSYTFQVGAHNAKGTHWSAYCYGRTVALPASPTSLHVTSTTGHSAALAWTDASNNEDRFVSQYKIGSGPWIPGPSVGANATSMTISGLSPATAYTFQVGAQNVAGTHWSAYAYGTTQQVLPAQPTSPHVTGTTGSTAQLAWTDASDNESGFVTQYRIGTGSWVAGPSVGANTTSVTVSGLHSGTTYTFQVGAKNTVGTHWSAYFYGSTAAFPAQPTNPSVSSTTTSSATLTWGDASNNEDRFVSQYKVGSGGWVAGPSVGANVTSMTIGGLSASTAYTFQIGAQNSAGTHWSAYAYGTTQTPVPAPGQPGQPVAGTPDSTHITVSWPAVPGATSYQLQWTHLRNPGNSDWTYWGSTGSTSVTIGVTTGQSFMFQVRAVNSSGSSSWSQWSNWVFTTVAVTVSQYATGGLSGHTCPYDSCQAGPTYPANHTIWIRCYVNGQNVQEPSQWGGYWTTVWDLASDGYYYTDAWLHTGSNNPVVPACDAGDVK